MDGLGDLIDKRGEEIDRLGALLDNSTNHMEDDIEERGKEIDSLSANRLIELKGEKIDQVSDLMDREVESRGNFFCTFFALLRPFAPV